MRHQLLAVSLIALCLGACSCLLSGCVDDQNNGNTGTSRQDMMAEVEEDMSASMPDASMSPRDMSQPVDQGAPAVDMAPDEGVPDIDQGGEDADMMAPPVDQGQMLDMAADLEDMMTPVDMDVTMDMASAPDLDDMAPDLPVVGDMPPDMAPVDLGMMDMAPADMGPADMAPPMCTSSSPQCFVNSDCVDPNTRCESTNSGITACCLPGPRGTDPAGTPCIDGNSCASSLCVGDGAGGLTYCSDECTSDADCPATLPNCNAVVAICIP